MELSERPVIFMTYANAVNKPAEYLPALGKERQDLIQELEIYDQKGWGIWRDSPASPEYLVRNLGTWYQQMVVFHFSGHALGDRLILTNEEGGSQSLMGDNLSNLLAVAVKHSLKLVFLNACLTKGHVEALQAIGVPIIIATHYKINDAQARAFARIFYHSLIGGMSIEQAYNYARAGVGPDKVSFKTPSLIDDEDEEDEEDIYMDIPWEMFCQVEEAKSWTLKPDNSIDARLREGSLKRLEKISWEKDVSPHLLTPMRPISPPVVREKAKGFGSTAGENPHTHPSSRRQEFEEIFQANPHFGEIEPLQHLYEKGFGLSIFKGRGGMRKSTALLSTWDAINHQYRKEAAREKKREGLYLPIPIYIPLFEFNSCPPALQEQFIIDYILHHYLDSPSHSPELKGHLWNWLRSSDNASSYPKILLLLDGLNEISIDKSRLLNSIKRDWASLQVAERADDSPPSAPVQIVITAHSFSDVKWAQSLFSQIEILPLAETQIDAYLDEKLPRSHGKLAPELKGLLSNPTMLSLYAEFVNIQGKVNNGGTAFLQGVSTPGELWDLYIQSFIDKAESQKANGDIPQRTYTQWQLNHLLPSLCFEMVKRGRMEYRRMELRDAISAYIQEVTEKLEVYYEVFPESEKIWEILEQDNPGLLVSLGLTFSLLSEKQDFLQRRGQRLSFLQQSYRRYFAARHILNGIALSLRNGQLPMSLKAAPLPFSLSRMVGQVLRVHKDEPQFNPLPQQWSREFNRSSLLRDVLDQCRGNANPEEVGYLLWNIFSIWWATLPDLSGIDLTRLNLYTKNINLNAMRCSRLSPNGENGYFTAQFAGSRLLPNIFFPEGHTERITAITFSPDGKIFLTAAMDGSIKIWSIRRGICLNTLINPGIEVTSLTFHPHERKFLAGASDGSITEWAIQQIWGTLEGVRLQTFAAHDASIRDLNYEPDGKAFLSVGADNTVRLWTPALGKDDLLLIEQDHSMPLTYVKTIEEGVASLQGYEDGTVLIEALFTPVHIIIKTQAGPVSAIYFNETEPFVLTAHQGKLIAWQLEEADLDEEVTTTKLWERQLGDSKILVIVHDNSRDQFLIGTEDGSLYFFTGEGEQLAMFEGQHQGSIHAITFAEDHQTLFTSGEDNRINRYLYRDDAEIPRISRRYSQHIGAVTSLYTTEKFLFSGGKDGMLRVWDLTSSRFTSASRRYPVKEITPPSVTALSAQGDYVLVGYEDGSAILWEVKSTKTIRVLLQIPAFTQQTAVCDLAFLAEEYLEEDEIEIVTPLPAPHKSRLYVSLVYQDFRVGIFLLQATEEEQEGTRVENWTLHAVNVLDRNPLSFRFHTQNPDFGRTSVSMVSIPTRQQLLIASNLGFHMYAYDPDEKLSLKLVSQVQPGILHLAAHPTEDRFASYQEDGTLIEWSRPAGERRYESNIRPIDAEGLNYMHYSLDGTRLLIGTKTGDLKEWMVDSGENTRNFYSQRLEIECTAISPDGDRLLTVSDDAPDYYVIKEWDLKREVCRAVYVHHNVRITQVCYDSTCETLFAATDSGMVIANSTLNGEQVQTYQALENNPSVSISQLLHLSLNRDIELLVAIQYSQGSPPSLVVWEAGRGRPFPTEIRNSEGEPLSELPISGIAIGRHKQHLLIFAHPVGIIDALIHKEGEAYVLIMKDFTPVSAPEDQTEEDGTHIMAFRQDGAYAAYADDQGHIHEIPLYRDFQEITPLPGEGWAKVNQMAFIRQGNGCVFLSEDREAIYMYEGKKDETSGNWKEDDLISYEMGEIRPMSLAAHPFLPVWATGDDMRTLHFWMSGNATFSHSLQLPSTRETDASTRIEQVAYSPTGSLLLCSTENTLFLYDTQALQVNNVQDAKPKLTHQFDADTQILRVLFSPNEKKVMVHLEEGQNRIHALKEWNIETDSLLSFDIQLPHHESPSLTAITYDTKGEFIAAGTETGALIIWQEGEQGTYVREIRTYTGSESPIRILSLYELQGESKFLALHENGTIRDWILGSKQPLTLERLPSVRQNTPTHILAQEATLVYISDTESRLSPGDAADTYRMHPLGFSSKTLPYWQLPAEVSGDVSALGYSACGTRLRVGYTSGQIVQWKRQGKEDWNIWEFDYHIKGHDDGTTARTRVTGFVSPPSPEGEHTPTRYFSASDDGTFREWDVASGNCLQVWPNVPGMWMQGVDLREVAWARPLSKHEKRLLRLYGAQID